MCGINAIINLQKTKIDVSDLYKMSAIIEHRGPDSGGFSIHNNGCIGLSHVRLSIIDLQSGQQPLCLHDGNYAITFNGELYDYKIHRENLIQQGHTFQTQSDTEVLLRLYVQYGELAFSMLNGEFSFVLWDNQKKLIYAVKDRFGIKPLFYHQSLQRISFSSEIKALLTLSDVEPLWNPDFFVGPFFGAHSSTNHVYKNIYPVPPGHFICISPEKVFLPQAYWSPNFDKKNISFDEAIAGVRDKTEKAVRRRMVADVPIGCYLSGGLDSTLVCALMSKENSQVRSFNLGFEKTIYDESVLAKKIAQYYSVDFVTTDCTSENLIEEFENTLWHVEMPIANPNAIAKKILSRFVQSQNYKVCLTGEGSDEVFGGYPYFKLEVILKQIRSEDKTVAENGKKLLKKFFKMEFRSEGLLWSKGFAKSNDNHFHHFQLLEAKKFLSKIINSDFLQKSEFISPLDYFLKMQETTKLLNLQSINDFDYTKWISLQQLSCYIIPTLGDRPEMAHSIECRTPFLDIELVDFVNQIPVEYFIDIEGLKEKNLLRLAFQDVFPPFMKNEHKHPFLSPNWHRLYKTSLGRQLFEELISEKFINEVGIFRSQFVKNLKRLWLWMPQNNALWKRMDILMGLILSTQGLHRSFIQTVKHRSQNIRPGFKLDNCG